MQMRVRRHAAAITSRSAVASGTRGVGVQYLSSRILRRDAITFNPDLYTDVGFAAPSAFDLQPLAFFLPRSAASSPRGGAVCPSSDGCYAARRSSLSPRGGSAVETRQFGSRRMRCAQIGKDRVSPQPPSAAAPRSNFEVAQ